VNDFTSRRPPPEIGERRPVAHVEILPRNANFRGPSPTAYAAQFRVERADSCTTTWQSWVMPNPASGLSGNVNPESTRSGTAMRPMESDMEGSRDFDQFELLDVRAQEAGRLRPVAPEDDRIPACRRRAGSVVRPLGEVIEVEWRRLMCRPKRLQVASEAAVSRRDSLNVRRDVAASRERCVVPSWYVAWSCRNSRDSANAVQRPYGSTPDGDADCTFPGMTLFVSNFLRKCFAGPCFLALAK